MKSLKKAIGFGFVTWLVPFAVSVSIFLLKMPLGRYMKDIGLGYFTFLIISASAAWLLHCQATPRSEKMSSRWNLSPQLSTNDEAVHSG